MRTRPAILVALAAAVTLTSVAAAGPDAAKQRAVITGQASQTTQVSPFVQRVTIVSKGVLTSGILRRSGEFVLAPLRAGALKRDSGPESGVANMATHRQRSRSSSTSKRSGESGGAS